MALAARSLRLDARSPLIHLLRGTLGLLMLLSLAYAWSMSTQVGAAGINLYIAVVRIDFFFVAVLGVALFATSITEERQEGSLGLMRMAGLNAISVLFGKSLSLLTVSISLLAVQLPFSMFLVTLGGVSDRQIFAGFVILGAFLMFTYALGLFCSTVCQRGAVASRWTFVGLLLANVWPAVWDLLQDLFVFLGMSARISSSGAFDKLTAWGALDETMSTAFSAPIFDACAIVHLCVAGGFLVLAWSSFDFVEKRAGRESIKRTLFGWDPWGGIQRVPRFSGNALVWKDYRLFVGGRRGMLLRFIAYGAMTILLGWIDNPFGTDFQRNSFGHSVLAMVGLGIVLDLGSLAGRVFRDEIAWETYSTLLLLPKSVLQISYGKAMGCLMAVLPPLCFLVIGMLCADATILLLLGPMVFCYSALLYMLLPIVAYVSLYLTRGAFPLTMFGFCILGLGLYFIASTNAMLICFVGVILFLVAWRIGAKMHERILDRLSELAGVDI